ncbi:MAG: protein kinase [Victivallaceae bacterium]
MKYEAGLELGGYRLDRRCGSGAYGTVFLASNLVTGKVFALKVIPMIGSSWERELKALIRYRDCAHPNLLAIHHIARTDDAVYYVMDAADNLEKDEDCYTPKTFACRISREQRIAADELRAIAGELLDAIDCLHRHGLIHRDIKPDNILWINGRAVLGDLGLLAGRDNLSVAGTFGFLPDEVIRGKRPAAGSDDFYALGKVLYCALTGNAPGDFPDYPAELPLLENANLIAATLAACQSPYLADAASFRRALDPAAAGSEPKARTVHATPSRRAVWVAAAVTLVLLGLIAGVVRHYTGEGDEAPGAPAAVALEPVSAATAGTAGAVARSFDDAVAKLRSDFERNQEKLRK